MAVMAPNGDCHTLCAQVLVLSAGRAMFAGPVGGLVPWFTDELGYSYDAEMHGLTSDWVLDLVCAAFDADKQVGWGWGGGVRG